MAPPNPITTTTTPAARAVSTQPQKRKAVAPPTETSMTPPNRPKFSPADYIGNRVLAVNGEDRSVGTVLWYENQSFLISFDGGHQEPWDLSEVCQGIGKYESDYAGPTWSRNHNPSGGRDTAELTRQVPHTSEKMNWKKSCTSYHYTGPTSEQEGGNPPFFVGKRVHYKIKGVVEDGYIDACYKRVGVGYGPDTLWHLNLPSTGKNDDENARHIMIKDHTRYFK